MPSSQRESKSANKLWYLIGGALLLVAAVILTLQNSVDHVPSPQTSAANTKSAKVEAAAPSDLGGAEAGRISPADRRRANTARAANDGNFPQIERILVDSSLTTDQSAEQLLAIVQRTELSEGERFEAMAHGLNLSFKTFAPAAADPALPAPLAQRYMDELANRNEARQEQIEGCLALMGNADEDIRTQAATQLAFYVEAETLTDKPDDLRKAAVEWVEKLKLKKQKAESEK